MSHHDKQQHCSNINNKYSTERRAELGDDRSGFAQTNSVERDNWPDWCVFKSTTINANWLNSKINYEREAKVVAAVGDERHRQLAISASPIATASTRTIRSNQSAMMKMAGSPMKKKAQSCSSESLALFDLGKVSWWWIEDLWAQDQ